MGAARARGAATRGLDEDVGDKEAEMAKLDAHQRNDKKRQNGNFTPQGKKGTKKKKVKTGGHFNKYAEFSKADGAMQALQARSERLQREEAREQQLARERRGYRGLW